jgi:leucyl/phenylalanyl-tRNA--protein transferase
MASQFLDLPWLSPNAPFPDVTHAMSALSDAPGLLALGGDLGIASLRNAYAHGIYPWFSEGQPALWWSPDPRMVLKTANFRLHRSMRKTLLHFQHNAHCEVRFDTAFSEVIQGCADAPRQGLPGTWILPSMMQAYIDLHHAGAAHSIETWVNGELVGGLYCVALGQAVFGESMFSKVPNASKIALSALVAFCRAMKIGMIDCQQNTAHLATLGAAEISRSDFVQHIKLAQQKPQVDWHFDTLYWSHILSNG